MTKTWSGEIRFLEIKCKECKSTMKTHYIEGAYLGLCQACGWEHFEEVKV